MLHLLKTYIRQKLVPKSKLVVFNYHQLGDVFNPKIHNKSIWNDSVFFESQLRYLQENYRIVSLIEGVESLKNNSVKDTLVCLTFDDGDASITSFAMPILNRLGIPATFFINTAYGVEKMGYWYNLGPYLNDHELIQASPSIRNTDDKGKYQTLLKLEDICNQNNTASASPFYADYKELEKCTNPLFHFGLHGHEHLRFSMLSYEDQKQNLIRNIESMSQWPNYIPFFAVPFGQPKDWNQDTLKIAQELQLIPLLAFQGYNTAFQLPLLRFSVDGMELNSVFKKMSPYQKTYYDLNNCSAK